MLPLCLHRRGQMLAQHYDELASSPPLRWAWRFYCAQTPAATPSHAAVQLSRWIMLAPACSLQAMQLLALHTCALPSFTPALYWRRTCRHCAAYVPPPSSQPDLGHVTMLLNADAAYEPSQKVKAYYSLPFGLWRQCGAQTSCLSISLLQAAAYQVAFEIAHS